LPLHFVLKDQCLAAYMWHAKTRPRTEDDRITRKVPLKCISTQVKFLSLTCTVVKKEKKPFC
jgi:hypothetical protein